MNINAYLESKQFNRKQSEILLAAVIMARATSNVFAKILLEHMDLFSIIAVRSLTAFALLFIVFRERILKITKRQLFYGFILGFAFYLVMFFELRGIMFTASSTIAFLENTAVVLVPLMVAVMERKAPEKKTVIRALVAVAGVALLVLKGDAVSFGKGEVYGVCTAFTYAASIIVTEKLSKKEDAITIGILQVGFMGLLSLVTAFALYGQTVMPQGAVQWGCLLYLAVICSGFGFTLQPLAQRGTSASRASSYCVLNPVVAAIMGYLWLSETMSFKNIVGAVLIILSILIK